MFLVDGWIGKVSDFWEEDRNCRDNLCGIVYGSIPAMIFLNSLSRRGRGTQKDFAICKSPNDLYASWITWFKLLEWNEGKQCFPGISGRIVAFNLAFRGLDSLALFCLLLCVLGSA